MSMSCFKFVYLFVFRHVRVLLKSMKIYWTHWGRMTHICMGKPTIIAGSDNGLSPDRRQVIIWTNAGLLLIGPIETNFSEILIEILAFSFKKIHLKMSSAKWRPFCLSLNVLRRYPLFSQQCFQRTDPCGPIIGMIYPVIDITHKVVGNILRPRLDMMSRCHSIFWYQWPLLLTWINLNHSTDKVWDEITYPFMNFNGCAA